MYVASPTVCGPGGGGGQEVGMVSAAGSRRLPCCERAIAREIRAEQASKSMERSGT